jgi:hypothetical protein
LPAEHALTNDHVHDVRLAAQRRTRGQEHDELVLHVGDDGFQALQNLLQPSFLVPTRTAAAAAAAATDHQAGSFDRAELRHGEWMVAHRRTSAVAVLTASSVAGHRVVIQRVVASVHLAPEHVELPQHGVARDTPPVLSHPEIPNFRM